MTPCSFSNAQISTTPVNHGNPQISDTILKHTNKTQHEYKTHNTIQLKLTIPTQISIKWTKKTQKTKRHVKEARRDQEGDGRGKAAWFCGCGHGPRRPRSWGRPRSWLTRAVGAGEDEVGNTGSLRPF